MAPAPGLWAPLAIRMFRHAFKKTTTLLKARFPEIPSPINSEIRPILARTAPRQPIHPAAFLRQSKGRWYTTHSYINATVRRFMSTGTGHAAKFSRSSFPRSAAATAVSQLTTRVPFASTLRPSFAGAIPRTAGGYTIGGGRIGGVRYFSHTPAAPAQVIHNVSASVRAFWLSGQKAQFDGMSPAGEKRYRTITRFQEDSGSKMRSMPRSAPGSFIDFHVNPTITALSPLGAVVPSIQQPVRNLNTEGLLDVLSVDFARALKDLAATMNDLKSLSTLGDLSITLEQKSILRVRFPGCDIETVERLCDEVGVQRGIIHQDPDFDNAGIALIFPFAPTSKLTSPWGSLGSETGHDFETVEESPWLEGYESMENSSHYDQESVYFTKQSELRNSSSYEGLEGIYRFLEECDNSKRI